MAKDTIINYSESSKKKNKHLGMLGESKKLQRERGI